MKTTEGKEGGNALQICNRLLQKKERLHCLQRPLGIVKEKNKINGFKIGVEEI